jgi:iron complex transport system permease protein
MAMTVVIAVVSLMVGQAGIHPYEILRILLSKLFPVERTWSQTIEAVIFDVRVPRLLAGLLVGAGLSVAGAAFQGLFRNPLVSPHILGVSAGAGFGAAIAILFFGNIILVQVFSFIFGLAAVFCTYALSRVYRTTPVLMLVLSGIIVGALFTASTSLLKYIADPVNQMPSIVFWLMGSLNNVSNGDLLVVGPLILAGLALLLSIRWRINLLTMGEEDARALGVNTELMRALIILSATVISASAVSITGIIGWIGLVIPHIGRLLVGPDNRLLLPVAALIGASYLVTVDTLARSIAETEIPIGILTAMVGAPIFAYLLRKNRPGW